MDRINLMSEESGETELSSTSSSRSPEEPGFSQKDSPNYESSMDKIRKNIMFHFMQRFFIEETELSMMNGSNGLSIGSLFNIGRGSTEGYTRLESEDDTPQATNGGQGKDRHIMAIHPFYLACE
ncbi:Uncharacterized protein FKW44_005353 [Caligus rogercresseyi]|uniref:Uncharacterized protein n=1 Tax=Caligus rogercresseyi TaxID=217165 RepID=A0A7T8QRY2_CALRO|nr:Uncharacterized protein FKW44_005353 [Caligus rogercresseyi]